MSEYMQDGMMWCKRDNKMSKLHKDDVALIDAKVLTMLLQPTFACVPLLGWLSASRAGKGS
jgi:hypothetical protein